MEARLFPVAAEIVSEGFAERLDITSVAPVLLVRFAGNEKAVTFQTEQSLALLKNADIIMDDAHVWRMIAAAAFWNASPETIWQIGALNGRIQKREVIKVDSPAMSLMQRIKKQLDPLGTLPNILAADKRGFLTD